MTRYIDADKLRNDLITLEPPGYSQSVLGIITLRVLDEQPTADVVEVRHGEWMWDDNAIDWGIGAWVCSNCHGRNDNIYAVKNTDPYIWVGSQYCPNCGARMDGRSDT